MYNDQWSFAPRSPLRLAVLILVARIANNSSHSRNEDSTSSGVARFISLTNLSQVVPRHAAVLHQEGSRTEPNSRETGTQFRRTSIIDHCSLIIGHWLSVGPPGFEPGTYGL